MASLQEWMLMNLKSDLSRGKDGHWKLLSGFINLVAKK